MLARGGGTSGKFTDIFRLETVLFPRVFHAHYLELKADNEPALRMRMDQELIDPLQLLLSLVGLLDADGAAMLFTWERYRVDLK